MTRRHHNTNGRQQVRSGKTAIMPRRLGRILIKGEKVRTMAKQCDLCNDRFQPLKGVIENARENRYCRECCTDPYRMILAGIHETIGISGYTIREINDLKSQKAALLAACKLTGDQITDDLCQGITPSGGTAIFYTLEELEQIQSAISQAE